MLMPVLYSHPQRLLPNSSRRQSLVSALTKKRLRRLLGRARLTQVLVVIEGCSCVQTLRQAAGERKSRHCRCPRQGHSPEKHLFKEERDVVHEQQEHVGGDVVRGEPARELEPRFDVFYEHPVFQLQYLGELLVFCESVVEAMPLLDCPLGAEPMTSTCT